MKTSSITILTLAIAIFSAMSVQAAYVIKIPMEQNLGGSLPTSSIAFVSENGGGSTSPVTPDPKPEEPETKPEELSRESVCVSAKQNVISIAASQNLDVTVKYISPLPNDKCVLMVKSVRNFADKTALINFGNSVAKLNIPNYSIGIERYSDSVVDMFISSLTTDVSTQADKIWSRYQTDKK